MDYKLIEAFEAELKTVKAELAAQKMEQEEINKKIDKYGTKTIEYIEKTGENYISLNQRMDRSIAIQKDTKLSWVFVLIAIWTFNALFIAWFLKNYW